MSLEGLWPPQWPTLGCFPVFCTISEAGPHPHPLHACSGLLASFPACVCYGHPVPTTPLVPSLPPAIRSKAHCHSRTEPIIHGFPASSPCVSSLCSLPRLSCGHIRSRRVLAGCQARQALPTTSGQTGAALGSLGAGMKDRFMASLQEGRNSCRSAPSLSWLMV